MNKVKEILTALGVKLKAGFIFIATHWKIIAGFIAAMLAVILGIGGYEKINKIFGKPAVEDDDIKDVIQGNDEEIARTKKWIKENKKLHETNEEAIARYNKFLADNKSNSDGGSTTVG